VKKMSPKECKTFEEVCRLNSDNFSTDNNWIMINEGTVTLTAQKLGFQPIASITIERRKFNNLIRWYLRKQKTRR
jgi:hypothetical protein